MLLAEKVHEYEIQTLPCVQPFSKNEASTLSSAWGSRHADVTILYLHKNNINNSLSTSFHHVNIEN
jgi:hypothetical protein